MMCAMLKDAKRTTNDRFVLISNVGPPQLEPGPNRVHTTLERAR